MCGGRKSLLHTQFCGTQKSAPKIIYLLKKVKVRGTWVAQSVEQLTSAGVMTSQSVSLSPALGSVLTAQSLEPASDSVSSPLSAPPLFTLSLSLKNK